MIDDQTPYFYIVAFAFAGLSAIWGAIDAIRREKSPWLIGPLCWTVVGLLLWLILRPRIPEKYLEVSEEEFQEARRRASQ